MLIIKFLLCLLFFAILPEILGYCVLSLKKERNNIWIESIVLGYMIEFAALELISLPLIFLRASFINLFICFITFIIIFLITFFLFMIKKKRSLEKEKNSRKIKNCIEEIKQNLVLKIVVGILVFIQVFFQVVYTHIDDDDSVYVAASTTTLQTNTLYLINPKDGTEYGEIYMRYALSPISFYYSIASKIVQIHPTILWHSVAPIVFTLITYIIYYLLSKKFFEDEKESLTFLIAMSFINIFGNYNEYTVFSYLLMRIHQGKSMIANIMIPYTWFVFLDIVKNKNENINWIIILIILLASTFVSGMGTILVPATLGILSLIFSIKEKDFEYIGKSIITMIPCMILCMLYII